MANKFPLYFGVFILFFYDPYTSSVCVTGSSFRISKVLLGKAQQKLMDGFIHPSWLAAVSLNPSKTKLLELLKTSSENVLHIKMG